MSRYDLDELRLEIVALADEIDAPLTEQEFSNLWHYGEAALLGTLSAYESVAEQEFVDAAEEEDEEERERREILADYGYEDFYDDSGYWEIEIVYEVDTG